MLAEGPLDIFLKGIVTCLVTVFLFFAPPSTPEQAVEEALIYWCLPGSAAGLQEGDEILVGFGAVRETVRSTEENKRPTEKLFFPFHLNLQLISYLLLNNLA